MIALAAGLAGCSDLTGANDAGDNADKNSEQPDPVANTPSPTEITCAYPVVGNYGVSPNMVVPKTHQWQGYAELTDTNQPAQTISAGQFFDCDGSRGIHAIMVDTSQYG
jgi:hypothetical protein